PFIVHPEQPELSRIFTPTEHCRVKGIPEELIQGLSDTIAHQILGQSVVFPAFEALALALGNSLWSWVGMMPIMVEVVDESQPVIGGEDFHWATALVDAKGTLKLSPAAKKQGMPFNIMDGQLAVYSPNGTKKSCGHEPCEYLPVMMSGDAIMVTSSLVH
ncbi:DNA cytosine methyltransferase, partial [Salmonella enterica]|nr:DNA cytosine methyltransferase [Salmonella enterica]